MIFLYYILITFCILVISFTLGYQSENNSIFLFLLPLGFFLCLVLFIKTYFYLAKSLVFKVFLFQASLMYLLLPILYSSGQIINMASNSYFFKISILVMVVELFLVFLVFLVFAKNQYNSIKNQNKIIFMTNSYIVPLVLISMFSYIYFSGAFVKINPIWQLSEYVNQEGNFEFNEFGVIVFNTFRVTLVLYLISLICRMKFEQSIKDWFLLLTVFGSSLFIVGVSRFSILLNIVILFALLASILNEKSLRKIFYILVPVIIVIMISVTISKFSKYDENFSAISIITASSINSYVSGFGNISLGLELYNNTIGFQGILYLLNDVFQNIPVLSNFTDKEYKTGVKFNEMIYGHREWADQIVPVSISGLFHYGYIGLCFYAPFFIYIALYMERLSYKVKYIGYKYVFLYLSLSFSLIFMLNFSSFNAILFRTFVFIFIPLFIIRILSNLKLAR